MSFPLFAPFADRLRIAVIAREHLTDDDVAARIGADACVGLHQVHGAATIVARAPVHRDVQADGAATDVPGLALTVRWADCQNFVFFAPEHRVISVLHAGWRGLIAGAITAHLTVLQDTWNIRAADLHAGIGPSLCAACATFTDPARELPGTDPRFIRGCAVDLRGMADAELDRLGVPAAQRERVPDCTRCNPDRYWTYRGGHRGEVAQGACNVLAAVLLP